MRHRDARGPDAGDHHLDRLETLVDDLEGVQQRRQHDDRRAVLVVVEHRDVQQLAQPPLDLEAARRRDVLEVDAAEDRRDRLDDQDDLLDVLRVQAERERVDAGELLEQDRLALHHRQRAAGADVAEPEDGAAVGHHGHRVALDRQVPDRVRVVRDRPRDARDARRVRHREIVAGLQRHARADLELAAEVAEEGAVRDRLDLDAGQRAHRGRDALDVRLVLGEDRDVAHLVRLLDAHEIDRPEQRALLADRRRDAAERPGLIGQSDPQNRAERRRHVRHAHEPTPGTTSAARGFAR